MKTAEDTAKEASAAESGTELDPLAKLLLEEYNLQVEKQSRIKARLKELRQKEQETIGLIRACETLLKGTEYAPERPFTPEEDQKTLPLPESRPQERRQNHQPRNRTAERADQVVAYLESIYPESKQHREIYAEMQRRGMDLTGTKKPTMSLLVSYSADQRLQRVGRGTYQAKRSSPEAPKSTRPPRQNPDP